MGKSFAPYNFIPFSEKEVPTPYLSGNDLPRFDHPDGEYSGRIDYEVHNWTGISVGGNRPKNPKKDEVYDGTFCTDGNGDFIIPGSTMRGFIRNHVEILSASYPEMIGDQRYLFRKFADSCTKVRDEYKKKLQATKTSKLRIPDHVRAGFLYKEKVKGQEVYYILPAKAFGKEGNTFFQVHEVDLRKARALPENCYMYREQIEKYNKEKDSLKIYNGRIEKKKNKDYKAYRGISVTFDYTDRICNIGKGVLKGILLNSAWMNGKTHHYIVSGEKGTSPFSVDKKKILSYQEDYRRNCVQNDEIKKNREFYGLPEKYGLDNAKLFFYKLKDGSATGELVGFGPTPYFRVFYDFPVLKGIPCQKPRKGYDYTQALFGFTRSSDSYKSRLSFTNCVIQDKAVKAHQVKIYAGSPRGTAFQMYLDQEGKRKEDLNTYNYEYFKLRGYKFYWKHSVPIQGNMSNVEPNTSIAVIPQNNCFRGSIYFENLKKEELGLLLWALGIKEEGKKTGVETWQIGNGKPYGFGKISLENIRIKRIDPVRRYTSLEVEEKDITEQALELKQCYQEYLKKHFGIDFQTEDSLKVYQAYAEQENAEDYLGAHPEPYMTLQEYEKREPLPCAAEIMWGNFVTKQGCIWIAGYSLFSGQEKRLIKQMPSGMEIDQEKRWLEEKDISPLAEKYAAIALPSGTRATLLEKVKEQFDKVFVAVKTNGRDSGWKCVK